MAQQPIIVGGYELGSYLGEGAFSKVYKGVAEPGNTKHALHQFVAIKVVKIPPQTPEVDHRKKILKEVKLHKHLEHLNILRLLNYTEQENQSVWIVLEYADGGDLFDKITPDIGISEELAHLYFYQLLAALNYCHLSGIAHRDIKPENMLLDRNGNLKLADFGLAALFSYQGKEKKLVEACGSAPYAAPELALGTPYRAQPVDVWSAGIVLFTILVGNTPWDQPTAASPEYEAFIADEFRHEDPWNRLPEELLSLLLGILRPNPKERAKITDIAQHPWFANVNPLMGKDGQVKHAQTLWDRLYEKLAENGEFDIQSQQQKSHWSSDGSEARPSATSQESHQQEAEDAEEDSELSPPMPSMQRSQARSRDVFSGGQDVDMVSLSQSMAVDAGNEEEERERAARNAFAKEAIRNQMSQQASMRMRGSNVGTQALTAASMRHSQVSNFAPSQSMNPNVSRFFTYHPLSSILEGLESVLTALGAQHRRLPNDLGGCIQWATLDTKKRPLHGKIRIDYEATRGDYENAEGPNSTSYQEMLQSRSQYDASQSQDGNGSANRMPIMPRTGQGQGGFVVHMAVNSGEGYVHERKKFYKELERRLPPGLVQVR